MCRNRQAVTSEVCGYAGAWIQFCIQVLECGSDGRRPDHASHTPHNKSNPTMLSFSVCLHNKQVFSIDFVSVLAAVTFSHRHPLLASAKRNLPSVSPAACASSHSAVRPGRQGE